jgi:hypothetical protein
MIRLLMRVREAPTQPEIKARAHAATETSMALHLLAARRRKQEPEAAPKKRVQKKVSNNLETQISCHFPRCLRCNFPRYLMHSLAE